MWIPVFTGMTRGSWNDNWGGGGNDSRDLGVEGGCFYFAFGGYFYGYCAVGWGVVGFGVGFGVWFVGVC